MSKNLFRKELETLKPYVPGKPIEAVKKEFGLERIVKLASNENPLGPSPKAIEAIKKEADQVHLYPDPGAMALREVLEDKFGIPGERIVLGNGGEELIKLIAQTFIEEGDEAIMGLPSFSLYEIAVSHMGGVCHQVPLTKDLKHDLATFEKKLNDKTKLVFICNPNNPTGNIMSKEEVEGFVAKLPDDVVLIMDEAYFEYARLNEAYPNGLEILAKRPNTIVLRTLSKVAGIAGVRIGYAFTSAEIATEMNKVRGVFNVNRIAQAAACAALQDEDHIEKTVALNKQSLDAMMAYFDEKGLPYAPADANFVFVDTKRDSRVVFDKLQRMGVIMRPGFLWGYDTYMRVSSGTMEQTEIFIEAMEEVLASVDTIK
jgi:histidinol-phosphate aminotransferase